MLSLISDYKTKVLYIRSVCIIDMELSKLIQELQPGERYCTVQGEKGVIHTFFAYGTLNKSIMKSFFREPEHETKEKIPGKNLFFLHGNKPILPEELESRVVANRVYAKSYGAFGDLVIMSATETEDCDFTFKLGIATTNTWELARKIAEIRVLTQGKGVPKKLENEMINDLNMTYLIDCYAERVMNDSTAQFNNNIDDSSIEHKFAN